MLNCKNFGNKAEFNVLKLLLKTDRNKANRGNEETKGQCKRGPKEIHRKHIKRHREKRESMKIF